MHLFGDPQQHPEISARESHGSRKNSRMVEKLRSAAAIACLLAGTAPSYALGQQNTVQQAPNQPNQTPPAELPPTGPLSGLPPAPAPNATQPVDMRPGIRDFTRPRVHFPNPVAPYTPTSDEPGRFMNSVRLDNLVKDGKIYLSLSDAILLALENNYDIAIARYNLDIADTDILRAKAGSALLGAPSGLVTGTLSGGSGTSAALSTSGGPGGTSGGASTGASGLSLTTNGGGPLPENLDPAITGTVQLERQRVTGTSLFVGGSQNTDEYNFAYNQGFLSGTQLQVGFNNSRTTSSNAFNTFSPALQSSFRATLTQHLLQGFGTGVNGRFIVQAKNDRRITNSAFRQQLLYTINQVENIYWSLVSAYEDVQAKTHAVEQSKQLASDNRKQLEIGTLAPLDVVNADSSVASDQQNLIVAQTNLQYEQLIMKQAIARNLNDPVLSKAPIIPTDRVSLIEMPEERQDVEELVRQAYANRPEIETDILQLKNDQITLKGVKNGLLPTLDAYAFYGASAVGGAQSPYLNCNPDFTSSTFIPCPKGLIPTVGYGSTFSSLFQSENPDKGIGFSMNIPIRNRTAQAEQARSVLEYRQAQMRLEQQYVQIRMQVINGQFALTNDRAQVQSAVAAREYAMQSLDAEEKKYHLGASTTYNVLQQQRNLATAQNNAIAATAQYAKDRASLEQILADTLDKYGVSIGDAVTGKVNQSLNIPGLEAAKPGQEVQVPPQPQQLQQQEQQPVPQPETAPQTPPTAPPPPAAPQR